MTVQQLSTIKPDVEDIVTQLQSQLSTKNSWKDLLTTSVGETILEFIATVGGNDQYAIERAFKEMFPQTARLDSSIYAITRLLGVRLQRKVPAQTSITVVNTGAPVVISPFTQLSVAGYSVYNRDAITIPTGAWTTTTLSGTPYLYEGQIRTLTKTATGNPFQTIISTETNFTIANEDVLVEVNSVAIPRTTDGLWNYKVQTPPISATDVWQDLTTPEGALQILFGNDLYGLNPVSGATLDVTYAVTTGAQGNDGSIAGQKITYTGQPVTLTITADAGGLVGGGNEIATSLYKTLAPQLFGSSERAVTQQDYNATALLYSTDIVDAVFLGQRDLDSTSSVYMNLCKVWLLYNNDINNGGVPWNNTQFNNFIDFMRKRSMYALRFFYDVAIAANPDPDDGPTPHTYGAAHAVPVTINIAAEVSCKNYADLTEVQTAVDTALDNFLVLQYGSISRDIYVSDIMSVIKQAHAAIDYVNLNSPTSNVLTNYKTLNASNVVLPLEPGGSIIPGNYEFRVSAIFDSPMYPGLVETKATEYTVATVTTNPSAITLSWSEIAGAVGYNIYCDRTYPGNPYLVLSVGASSSYTFYAIPADVAGPVIPPNQDSSGLRYPRKGTVNITTTYTYR